MKCPYCESPISLPKYRKHKTIYAISDCCDKPIRLIPTVEFRVAKDITGQGAKSSIISRSLRRTNLIKRLVKETIESFVKLRFEACVARPVRHPEGAAGFKVDGVFEYLILAQLHDSVNDADVVKKLEAALKDNGIEALSIERCTNTGHQFRISVMRLTEEEVV